MIGARFYSAGVDEEDIKIDYLSPRDANGHGTHTASTAAGSVVEAASFHGLAAGAARGGAPRARIAVYKSVWGSGHGAGAGNTATVLAAMDDAIHDGVDVLSLSLVVEENSFGALHAVQKGITVVYTAGNYGPAQRVVKNTAPWVITVAASKIDRSFPTVIALGNKQKIVGQSLYYQGKNSRRNGSKPLASGGLCYAEDLNGTDVRGKLVLCVSPTRESLLARFPIALSNVLDGGGSGLIFAGYTMDLIDDTAICQGIACVLVDLDTAKQIAKYMGETR